MKPHPAATRAVAEATAPRVDARALKRAYRIADVVAAYGLTLSRSGSALVGRCPFHPDGGRPNLYVYVKNERWHCYRCGVGGDALDFVQRIEGVGFREAARILAAGRFVSSGGPTGAGATGPRPRARRRPRSPEPAERDCLAAAVELYANRLLTDPRAVAYVEGRGLDRTTLERFRVGFAAGDELTDLLRWRGLPAAAAVRAGLLYRDGKERLAGRIVVPELRGGAPVWLVGRTIDNGGDTPKYLGLPGPKPLLGWERARHAEVAVVVEGVFDLLVLGKWGIPAVALVGTHAGPRALDDLECFRRLYLALDADAAGQEATAGLLARLGARATPVRLPPTPGIKDVADLATQPGGRAAFFGALADAARAAPVDDPHDPEGQIDGRHGRGAPRARVHDTSKGTRPR
jgi:DNA primase catalytic core